MGTLSYEKTLFDIVGMTKRNKRLFDQGHHYDVMSVSSKSHWSDDCFEGFFLFHIACLSQN